MDSPGRPTLYRPELAGQAYGLCLLGATNRELPDHFGVARSTTNKWRQDQPAFAQSLKRGRRLADHPDRAASRRAGAGVAHHARPARRAGSASTLWRQTAFSGRYGDRKFDCTS